MSSSINTSKSNIGSEFLKRTREHISGALGEYITEVMPTTTSTLSEAKNTVKEINAAFKNTTQSIFPKIRELKTQASFRNIAKWYMKAEDDYGLDMGDFDSDLSFDLPDDMQSEIATVEISESTRNASKVSSAVIESSQQMVEAQISSTANITATLDKQIAVLTAGFDKVNSTLEKMMEVIAKNTSGIIEATVAANNVSSSEEMISRGKFDLNQYKKIVQSNFNNSEFGMITSFIPLLTDPNMIKDFLSPKSLMKMGINFGINKASPNFKQGMKHLDDAINDTIMTSLIRVFENSRNNTGVGSQLGRLFGIDASTKRVSTEKSALELKSVPFDTITKESITNAIPGYLRKILVALGGPDEVYNYRTRSFMTQNAINQEFSRQGASLNNLQYASNNIRNSVNVNSAYNNALYDLMIADLGQRVSSGTAQSTAKNFVSNKKEAVKYVRELVKGTSLDSDAYNDQMYAFIKSMSNATKGMGHVDLMNQVYKNNIERNQRMSDYVRHASSYNVDLSEVRDSYETDQKRIKDVYGIDVNTRSTSNVSLRNSQRLAGTNYTNIALFEIYRRLNKGINVFQVGSSNTRTAPYKERGEDYLPRPNGYRPKDAADVSDGKPTSIISRVPSTEEDPNILKQDTEQQVTYDADGNPIEEDVQLTKGERFSRWAKKRGGALGRAVLTGDKNEIQTAFGMIVRDVSEVTGDTVKSSIQKVNETFGNISGYLGHKMFGNEYSYMETGEDGKKHKVTIGKNEKGGIIGFVKDGLTNSFSTVKAGASKWFNSVASYFDYGDTDDNKNGKSVSKRKKFISASVGALAGGGILGGPIGVLMGAIAGNAVGGLDITGKIKDLLFGRDDKGKAKGLLTKLGDKVIDPIQYQLEKTAHYVGGALKKHIIGPLSDIGYAIKERISNTAESVFGKAFKTISNVIIGPFKLLGKGLLNLVKAPVTFLGNITRASMGATGTGVEGGLGILANIIGGKGAAEGLKNRRKQRAEEFKQDKKDSGFYFGINPFKRSNDYKEWQEKNHAKRAEAFNKFGEYTSEKQVEATEETAQNTNEIANATSQMNDNLDTLTYHATHTDGEHSIFTHDHGIHDRLDKLIGIFTGKYNDRSSVTGNDSREFIETTFVEPSTSITKQKQARSQLALADNNETYANAALTAAASVIASDEITDNEELTSFLNISNEAEKLNGNTNKIKSELSDIMNAQPSKKEESDEKKSTLWDTIKETITDISSGIGSILGSVFSGDGLTTLLGALGAITGLYALFKSDGAIGKIFNNVQHFLDNFFNNDSDDSSDLVTDGVNSALSLADMNVDNASDLVIPGTSIYHNNTDAAGNQIVNQTASHAKENILWAQNLRNDIVTPSYQASMAEYYKNNALLYDEKANAAYAKAQGAQGVKKAFYESQSEYYNGKSNASTQKRNELINPQYSKVYQQNLNDMSIFQDKANIYKDKAANSSGIVKSWYESREKYYNNKAENALNNAIDIEENGTSNSSGSSTVNGLGRNIMRFGVLSGVSTIAGNAAGGISKMAGLDDQTSQIVDNTVTRATSGALVIDQLKSGLTPGRKSLVDKIIDGLKTMLEFIAEKLKSNKLFSALSTQIDDIVKKVINACPAAKFTADRVKQIEALVAKVTGKDITTIATGGTAIAFGMITGLLSGFCGVEHLFQIKPGDSDTLMQQISGVFGTIFGTLEWTPIIPVQIVIISFEVIDSIVQGVFGTGIKQFIAQSLYNLLTGDSSKLAEKQSAMASELAHYNETYGSNLDTSTFNDLVNNRGLLDQFWRGKNQYDENGHLKFDEAGGRIDGGFKGLFVGGEKSYLHDEDGNVLRANDGSAVQAVDAHGNVIKKDSKWGDAVGRGLSSIGRFFAGGDVYATDASGQAIWDNETQSYVVDSTEKNIFGKIGDAYNYVVDTTKTTIGDFVENWNSGMDTIKDTFNNIGSGIKSQFDKAVNFGAKMHQEEEYANSLLDDPDSSWRDLFKFEEDPDNPLNGFYKASAIAARLSIIPGAALKSIARDVSEKLEPVKSAITDFSEKWHSGMDVIKSKIDEFSDNWHSGMDTIKDNITSTISDFGDKWTDGVDVIKSKVDEFSDNWHSGMDTIKDNIESSVIGDFIDKWNDGMDVIKSKIDEFSENWNNGMDTIKDNITSTISDFGDKWTDGVDVIKSKVDEFSDNWHSGMDTIKDNIESSVIGDFIDKWNDGMDVIKSKIDEFSENWNNGMDTIKDNITSTISDFGDKWTDGVDVIKSKVDDFGEKWTDGMNTIKDKISSIIGDFVDDWNSGMDTIKSKVDEFSDNWHSGMDTIKEGASNFFSGIGEWFSNGLDNAWDWLKGGETARGGGLGAVFPKKDNNSDQVMGEYGSTVDTTTIGGNPLNKSAHITSAYQPGGRNDITGNTDPHYGIDITTDSGDKNATVSSRFEGTIAKIVNDVPDSDTAKRTANGWSYTGNNSGGNQVVIRVGPNQDPNHPNGFFVTNMHLKANSIPGNLTIGSKVNIGDKIGSMGSTGWSTGPHLHYEFGDTYNKDEKNSSTTWDPSSSTGLATQGGIMPNISASTTQTSSDDYVLPDYSSYGYTTSGYSSTASSSSDGKMTFSTYISKILGHAKNFLSKITGGLLFGDTTNNTTSTSTTYSSATSSINSSSNTSGYNVYAGDIGDATGMQLAATKIDPNIPIELLTNAEVNKLGFKFGKYKVIDIISGIDYDIYWGGTPGSTHTDYSCADYPSTKNKKAAANYGSTTDIWHTNAAWTPRPCILQIDGHQLAVGTHSFNHGCLIGGNPDPSITPHNPNPEKDSNGNWLPGSHFCMYYKDSVSNAYGRSTNAIEHQQAAAKAYELGQQLIEIRKSMDATNTNYSSIGDTGTPSKEDVWRALRARGFSEYATAGIMGCWEQESHNTSARVEGDYLSEYPGYNNVTSSSEAMDDWVVNHLFPMYKRSGISINKKYYGPYEDGHYYPGFGLAQWTGTRTQNLVNFAKAKNKPWTDFNTQMQFFDSEMNSSPYSKMIPALNSATSPTNATSVFFPKYESGGSMSGVGLRQTHAENIYRQLHGLPVNTSSSEISEASGMGGESAEEINTAERARSSEELAGIEYRNKHNISKGSDREKECLGGESFNTSTNSMISTSGNNYSRQTRSMPTNKRTSSGKSNSNIDTSKLNQLKQIAEAADNTWNLSNNTSNNSEDINQLETIMMQILAELKQINGNTSSSTSLLGALNEKDFVDQGLRNSITALGKASSNRRKGSKQNTLNYNNTRMISSLVRP